MEIVKSSSMIQSLQVGIRIINTIALAGQPQKFTDIQERTNLTKSTLYKYLNTLTQLELLYRDQTGLYHLGHKWIQYGMRAIDQEDVTTRVIPYLQEISQRSDCTVLFTIWTNNGPIIARIQSSNQALNIGAQMGSILPPNSSTGKIFNCFLHPSDTNEWVTRYDHGHENQKLSEQELQQINTHKIAFANEPLVPSVSSMSIPLFNYNAELLGALTVVGFAQCMPTSHDEELSQYLMKKSLEISKTFGYRED